MPNSLTYAEALAVLDEALVFGIEPSLDGITALSSSLGNQQERFVSLQVAGTNGKSSTARMLAALLHAEGFKVGLYTSPELVERTERYEIDGEVISHECFARIIGAAHDAALEQEAAAEASGASVPTFTEFELLTAAAFALFAQEQVDFAVLEVGMGGRWDATSIVNPSVAVITGIGLDHIGILGDTVEKIAAEKAAIIKPATSVILGPGTVQTQQVFLDRCRVCDTFPRVVSAKSIPQGRCEKCDSARAVMEESYFAVPLESYVTYTIAGRMPRLVLDIAGIHDDYLGVSLVAPSYQAPNMATAVAAAEAALGRALDASCIEHAFASLVLPGRFECLCDTPLFIVDATHNPQGASVLAETIRERFLGRPHPTLLLAILRDKDARGIIDALKGVVNDIVVTQTASPRAIIASELAQLVEERTGCKPRVFQTPQEAVSALLAENAEKGAIVATGSITLAGEVKACFQSGICFPNR